MTTSDDWDEYADKAERDKAERDKAEPSKPVLGVLTGQVPITISEWYKGTQAERDEDPDWVDRE